MIASNIQATYAHWGEQDRQRALEIQEWARSSSLWGPQNYSFFPLLAPKLLH